MIRSGPAPFVPPIATREPAATRVALTGLTIALLALLLLLPLAVVFTEALSRGLGAVADALMRARFSGVDLADPACRRGQRAAEHGLWARRCLVHRAFPVSRPQPAADADRAAAVGLAGDFGPGLGVAVWRQRLVRRHAGTSGCAHHLRGCPA